MILWPLLLGLVLLAVAFAIGRTPHPAEFIEPLALVVIFWAVFFLATQLR